ncbi:MAG: GH116 family glycosyl hydrolase [Candidatus Omnitrophota bacterium]|jgi:non-lysosomal glucosylceramidase
MTRKRDFFEIPDCAWKRGLGDVPSNTASSCPDRGVALGGFGAGAFMYSISGAFGPWALKCGAYDQTWLYEGAFHVYEKVGSGPAKVKTLGTNPSLKPAWDKLNKGEAAYCALQPKGWVTYDCFTLDISQKFFSPIIPNNYKETSYPVAVWQFKFSNPAKEKAEASVMLTWPQPPFSGSLRRRGYKNILKNDGDITGIVLKADRPDNTPETQNSEWCVASRADKGAVLTYALSWNKDGDGSEVWRDFKADGLLGNSRLDGSDSAAAIAVKVSLGPGESKVVPVVLSWDFPVVKFGDACVTGTEWWRKYTEYFGRDSAQSFNIAKEALANYPEWEKKVDAWMNPVIRNRKYPAWLKTAAFNELYYTQFGGTFYESGLKSGHDREYMGLHEDDHKFFVMESIGYPFCETFDVRHYCSILTLKFWPEIERDILRCFADGIMHYDSLHQTPHDFGAPADDPFFKFDNYGTNKLHWKDLHAKFIQQVARYYYVREDREFLDYCWAAVKMTYEYMKSQDTDGDGLPNNNGSDNTYDAWGLYGTSLLCGGLWVGALEAVVKLAHVQRDPILKEALGLLDKARTNLDKQLWNEAGQYYRMDTAGKNSGAIMADGLNGQRFCETTELPDILPRERMVRYLKKVYEMCVVPLNDFNGDGVGDCGAINSRNADGSDININMAREVWPGSTYFMAATMYHLGLKEEALKAAYGCYYIVYGHEPSAYWFNTPEGWHDGGGTPRPTNPEQYQRARAVWELLLEIDDPYENILKSLFRKIRGTVLEPKLKVSP